MRLGYRVRQFLAALGLSRENLNDIELKAYLSPAQVELFQRMSVSERRHAFAVLHTLQKQGYSEKALLQAALLHDVGKVPPSVRRGQVRSRVRLWHRVVVVLLQSISPALLRQLALDKPHSWRYPFFIQLHHASLGAEMAAQAGMSDLAVALIRCHHLVPEESGLDAQGRTLLAALKAADEEN